MGSIGQNICFCFLFAVCFASFAAEVEKDISAVIGFASTEHNNCKLYITVSNNTDELLVDLTLYAEVKLFDADGIFVSHGSSFDEKNEVYLGSGISKVTRPNDSFLLDGRLSGGLGGGKVVCEEVETVEFRLKRALCKDRSGEDLDCNALLDPKKNTYQMSKLLELNW